MRCFLLLCLCLPYVNVIAQSCNCPEHFRDMVNKIETNYVGFSYKVTAANGSYYRHFTDSLEKSAHTADIPACLSAMGKWLAFFQDRHVRIGISEDSANAHTIRKAFSNVEKLSMSEQDLVKYLDKHTNLDSLEGIWEDESGAYRVGIVRKEGTQDTFTGLILKADSLFWMPGQIKMKIKKSAGKYEYIAFYSKYHLESTPRLKVNSNRLENGSSAYWYKVYPVVSESKAPVGYDPYFKVLDSKTCLIAIPSAMLEYKDNIDSMLLRNDGLIKNAVHFIIDLRNNTGGSVLCFEKLLPLIYTNPIITKGTSVLATEDNIREYENWDYPNISDSMKAIFQKEAIALRAHKGTLYNLWPDDTLKLSAVLASPRRVSIIINENCASSTELFLLQARQSAKVKLYGHHTMGAVDYSDAASAKLGGGLYLLRYSTSRSNRLPGEPIDNIGIQPDVKIPDSVEDWVKYVNQEN